MIVTGERSGEEVKLTAPLLARRSTRSLLAACLKCSSFLCRSDLGDYLPVPSNFQLGAALNKCAIAVKIMTLANYVLDCRVLK
jgi:hypothetical protein